MPVHNNVATTCTASHLTHWSVRFNDGDEKSRVKTQLRIVKELIGLGFKRDFDLIFVTLTDTQCNGLGVGDFLKSVGFDCVFKGDKDDSMQRHKETGPISLWTIKPRDYQEGLEKLQKKLEADMLRLDPPKRPDPARQKFPDLKLSALRKAKIVVDNASVDNRLKEILLVSEEKAFLFLKMTFGFDVSKICGKDWANFSTRFLKESHKKWKEEPVVI